MSAPRDLLCALAARAYPRTLRAEYGAELRHTIRLLSGRREYAGLLGSARLGVFLISDVVLSIARERSAELRPRSVPVASARAGSDRPPYLDAAIAGLAVLALYVATLAPAVAFWDSGEYLTAAHVLGIPHSPGNPLFVLLAHAWERLLAPTGMPAAVSINLFSAVASAAAHACWFLVLHRALRAVTPDPRLQRLGAALAVLVSATAFTVWNQSNVNEKVYTLSLLTVALVCWLALRWRDTRSPRLLLTCVFVIALSSTNHLLGVLVAPALLAFVLLVDWRTLMRPGWWARAAALIAVALLPHFFLPVRAAQRPVLAETEPTCASLGEAAASIYSFGRAGCPALSATLTREQYGKPSIRLDPTVYPQERPRSAALAWSQLANYAQYFDWQWARSLGGSDAVFGGLRPLATLLFLLLGLLGARAHWRRDRAGAVLHGVLFATLSLGLVVYLNFKYGYALARELYPDPELHEVRERDYFFLIGFSVWGLWCGMGLLVLWQRLSALLRTRIRPASLATAPVLLLALVPLGANWRWASRADDYTARDWAYGVLMSVEPYGVLVTNGDNDTFPLWYLQEVEGVRRDVTVMVTSYLNTSWYVRQVRDLTRPCPPGVSAATHRTRIVCQRRFEPRQLPPRLATLLPPAREPEDSVLPLSDAQIERVAQGAFVVEQPLAFQVGYLETRIAAGTTMWPADTFVAAIIQTNLGKRPIHFTTPSPVVQKLGLFDYTVRHGLTYRLSDSPVTTSERVVPLPRDELGAVAGAFVDVAVTDTILRDVAPPRGRITRPDSPFVDQATASIMLQFAFAHYAAAYGFQRLGDERAVQQHVADGNWWQGVVERS